MTIWAMLLYTGYGVISVDFSSLALCEQARTRLIKENWISRSQYSMCIERGTF